MLQAPVTEEVVFLATSMPRARKKNAQIEQLVQQQQDAEQQIAALQNQLQLRGAGRAPPIYRPATKHWDWQCTACGRIVWEGKPQCTCRLPRSSHAYGTTLVGPLRGRTQFNSAARQAVAAQRCVPPPLAPSYSVHRDQRVTNRVSTAAPAAAAASLVQDVGGHAAVSNHNHHHHQVVAQSGEKSRPTYADITAAPSTSAALAARPGAEGSAPPEPPMSATDRMAKDDMAVDNGDDDERTLPEELPIHKLNLRMLNLHKKITTKEKQLEREQAAIQEQQAEIALQQAKLVELQAAADCTREAISDFNDVRVEVSQRLAKAASTQNQPNNPVPAGQPDHVETAMDCLSRTFVGLQRYEEQSLAVKELLCQFAQAFQSMQLANSAPALPAGQLTLQQAFSPGPPPCGAPAQASGGPVGGASAELGSTLAGGGKGPSPVPEAFDISGGATTPTGAAHAGESVNAEEGITKYGRASNAHESPVPTRTPMELRPVEPAEQRAEGPVIKDVAMDLSEQAVVLWQPPPRDLTRAQLRVQLERTNEDQADRVRKRADATKAHRSNPY